MMEKSPAAIRRAIAAFLHAYGMPQDTPVMLVAGGALFMHGLRDTYTDLDIVVPGLPVAHGEVVFKGQEVEGGDLPSWRTIPNFDADKAWRNRVDMGGIGVMDLRSNLEFKLALNRPKDQADIQRLKAILRVNPRKKKRKLTAAEEDRVREKILAAIFGPADPIGKTRRGVIVRDVIPFEAETYDALSDEADFEES